MSRCLSLDPGASKLGWAIVDQIEEVFPAGQFRYVVVDYGVLELPKRDKKRGFNTQMDESTQKVYRHFADLHSRYYITHVAWEMVPAFGAMSERERVAACLTAFKIAAWKEPIYGTMGWTPRGMKKALTGNDKASKEQVKDKVFELFPDLAVVPDMPVDAYDAIGIARVSLESGKWTKPLFPLPL